MAAYSGVAPKSAGNGQRARNDCAAAARRPVWACGVHIFGFVLNFHRGVFPGLYAGIRGISACPRLYCGEYYFRSDMPMDNRLAGVLDLQTEQAHEDALRVALELGIGSVGADEGSLLGFDESTGDLVFVMTAGDMLSESVLRGQHVPVGQGLTGLAALTGEVQVGVPTDPSVLQPEHRDGTSPRFLIAAPMFAGKQLVGVLTAATYSPGHRFSEDQTRTFGRIAALAGIVVAERRRTRDGAELRASASVTGTADPGLSLQVAETLQRLTRGDDSRLRVLLQLMQQIEYLAAR